MLQNKRTLLLDMDGTLLDLAFDNHFWHELVPQEYARRHARPLDEVRHELAARIAREQGRLTWYCLDFWSETLKFDVAGLKRSARERVAYLPGAPDFLARARARGLRLVLTTNSHPDALEIKAAETGITDYFDAVHSAHDFGVPKEDHAFWDALRAVEPFEACDAVLIDDSAAVLGSAVSWGLDVVAVRQPDSRAGERDMSPLPSVAGVRELL